MGSIYQEVSFQITKFAMPVIIICGAVGNATNIAVLARRTLYKYSCSRYILALSINNMYFCLVTMIQHYMAGVLKVDLGQISIDWCRFFQYGTLLCVLLLPYYTVLISIDRYCSSSNKVRIRNLSTIKVSRYALAVVTLICALYALNHPILVTLRKDDGLGCRLRSDTTYNIVFGFMLPVLISVIAPALMTIFSLLTIENIRGNRMEPLRPSVNRRSETQLLRMLLVQIAVHVVLNVPSAVTYVMSFLPVPFIATPQFGFASSFSYVLFKASFMMPFFCYILCGQIYREELHRMAKKILRCHAGNQIQPAINTRTTQRLIQIQV